MAAPADGGELIVLAGVNLLVVLAFRRWWALLRMGSGFRTWR
jgi:hypothetical protein